MAGLNSNNIIQNVIEASIDAQQDDTEKEVLQFDPLCLYFAEDYIVKDKDEKEVLTIKQPTIGDFITYGESNLYAVILPFTASRTSYRVQLWDMGIDWNKVTDMWLFSFLTHFLNPEYSKFFFGDFDWLSLMPYEQKKDDGTTEQVLYSEKHDVLIDDDIREKICRYIQYMFNKFPPEPEFTNSKTLKKDLIAKDRQAMLLQKKNSKSNGNSFLLPLVSFCLNHPGFKYKKSELKEMGIAEFMDSVKRLQAYESTHALYGGMYGGFVDVSKMKDKEQLNFMRDL